VEPIERRGPEAYVAEFLGTFVLVLFIGVILAANSPKGLGYADFAVIGLLHAFVLTMLVATLGATSGAHFNPAVTATLAALRKIGPADALIYVFMQLLGAVAAALVVKLMITGAADATNYGATGVNPKFLSSDGAGFLAELIGTFALMWAIMGMAVNPAGDRNWAPFVIGATLGFAVMAFGPLTGAGLNPARAFGPALIGDAFGGAGTFLFVYVAGPLVGALLAGFAYQALVIIPQDRLIDREGRVAGHPGGTPGERPVDKLSGDPQIDG
jgi:glycerol uptake facilitator protein